MKTDINYSFLNGGYIIFPYCVAENPREDDIVSEFNSELTIMIKEKLHGDLKKDDDSIVGGENSMEKIEQVENIMKRVVKTLCMKYDCDFKVYIKYIKN